MSNKISALGSGSPVQDTDLLLVARLGPGVSSVGSDNFSLLASAIKALSGGGYTAQGSNFTAAKNNNYVLTASALTVTFPASPTAGDSFQLMAATASITAVTTARNGQPINSAASDITISNFWNIIATYVDATIGWRVTWIPTLLGILDLSGSSAGIKFPSTANTSSNANMLDAYAEGTWTPVLAFGGASVGITYGIQVGNYIRIGRLVYANMRIQLTSKGTSVGAVTVTGLPFSSNALDTFACGYNAGFTAVNQITGYASGTTLTFLNTNAGASPTLADTNFGASSDFMVSVVYFI